MHCITKELQYNTLNNQCYLILFLSSTCILVLLIQGLTGGTDQTSGGCPLGHTIPI